MKKLKRFSKEYGVLLKRSFLLLVLFVLPALCTFSDVTLTDSEYDQIMTELQNSQEELESSHKQIQELKQDLEDLKTISSLLNQGLDLQLKFYETQKKDQLIKNITSFVIGFFTGFATGNYTGIQIGIKISL